MPEQINTWMAWLEQHPDLFTLCASVLLVLIAVACNWLVKRILVRGLQMVASSTRLWREAQLHDSGIIKRLSNVVPALIISKGVTLIDGFPETFATVVSNVCNAFIVLTIAIAINGALDLVNLIYQRRPDAYRRPIKGYLQVVQIIISVIAAILMVAVLIDRSPLILLSGLGAMAAVLMLIFQDTILSLVASVQISSNDIVRVGDWIEMPQLNADGDVVDIALHMVKVQNWDKTITSVPTRRFITDPFKNWRGMQECGGRRIKRSLYIDQNSIAFLGSEDIERLQQLNLLNAYLADKKSELHSWNTEIGEGSQVQANTRRLTNLGTFRAYVENYLLKHPDIHQQMTQLVRQMEPTADGLPIEIYCFTTTISWARYEGIQSDIFDHMLAILPEFGLRIYQHPSGTDMRGLTRQQPDYKLP
ncbi:MAG: mechanosensitive ion channel family protein [Pseudomonadaceae bacterium]|uniref:mechanosensitive ion channel family protein n=1 Tax=Pseudomonas marincola TaxID=437900 RepID=UPI0008EC4A19|nr:mechanosensitive ion channel family protein [Pseudomonas marincola]MAB98604.1 mechanosensitive ion channel family protein [Pseudomonadaceae bacterium]MBQ53884.1 mechanosensitive ion channel family protein [Pseudomonadaceae bacterium]SFU08974.1 miniconductance mechanosensitive channel [Pseudomonas marincola]HCP57356.1 mechanosensitive ion channel family protein [Pseudomonas sp.]